MLQYIHLITTWSCKYKKVKNF